MKDHGVAWFDRQILSLKRRFEVRDGDLVILGQHVHSLELSDVDQHAARHEHADLLYAETGEPVARLRGVDSEAVVQRVADALMTESVELRTHLTELRHDQLFVRTSAIR